MEFLGLSLLVKNIPELDKGFVPLGVFFAAHQKLAAKPFAVAVHRPGGFVSVYETKVIGSREYAEADHYYLDRLAKFLLWARGGYRLQLCGDTGLGNKLAKA